MFIDFTAAWCVSCQVNGLMVFRSEEVRASLKERGFALLKADWTNHDPVITQTLASFGRNGVPFYVIYGKDKTHLLLRCRRSLMRESSCAPWRTSHKNSGHGSHPVAVNELCIRRESRRACPGFHGDEQYHIKRYTHLHSIRGKYIVLQWHNKDCPYVQAQYDSGNMPRLQKEWTSKGVIWLTIISSAVGKQGYVDGNGAEADVRNTGAAPTATLLDPTGTIGRAYRAQTTPHMFVINPEGTLIYNGAIDDRATTSKATVGGSVNYVSLALTESMAGKALSHPTSRPYGCSMKY